MRACNTGCRLKLEGFLNLCDSIVFIGSFLVNIIATKQNFS